MNTFLILIASVTLSFALGSVPFALLAAKIFGIPDPRTYGSKNPGASNVLRSGSKGAALFTLLGDAAKGGVAVILAEQVAMPLGLDEFGLLLVAVAAFLGHLYSVFLKFKGGKGVATAAGVILALDPIVGLLILGAWLATAFIWRYSSLSALLASVAAPAFSFLRNGAGEITVAILIIGILVIYRHWGNVQRLMAGTEPHFGKMKK